MSLETLLENILTNPTYPAAWALFVVGSLAVLVWGLWTNNAAIGSLMEIRVGIYCLIFRATRTRRLLVLRSQTDPHDSLWHRGFRSVRHCYSGCGAGEIVGVVIALGLLSLGNLDIAFVTFALAYVAGYAMTVGPLLQEGVACKLSSQT